MNINVEIQYLSYFINESHWAALTTSFCPKCLCGQLDLDLTNQNNRHAFLRPYVKSDE